MSAAALLAAFETGKAVIERIFPDPTKRAEEIRKLEALKQQGDLAYLNAHIQILLAQIKVNQVQAQSKSWFVAGARPAVIWAGVAGLFWTAICHPLMTWAWVIFGGDFDSAPPPIENEYLYTLLSGLLGVAGMRSFDKAKGVATDRIGS